MNAPTRLSICQQCSKRAFSPKTGLVCSLTNEKPAFETKDCPDYFKDPKVDPKQARAIAITSVTGKSPREKLPGWAIILIIIMFLSVIASFALTFVG